MFSFIINYCDHLLQSYWFTFTFFDDILLFVLVLVQLLLISYFNLVAPVKTKDGSQIGYSPKARFYILLRLVFRGLLCVIVLKLLLILVYYDQVHPVLTLEHYTRSITNTFALRDDPFCRYANLFITVSGLYYLSYVERFMKRRGQNDQFALELPVFILIIILALRLLIAANDLVLIILALEIISFSVVILMASQLIMGTPWSPFALEAAVKYFVLNAIAVSFLLLATVFFYLATANTNLMGISTNVVLFPDRVPFIFELLVFGTIFFLFGYFLKIGVAPFHNWVPDVYDGAELPITILLMTLIGPTFILKLMLILGSLVYSMYLVTSKVVFFFFYVGAILSIFVGTIGAFNQMRLKRFLAYTGLTHLGFILLAFSSQTTFSVMTALLYIFIYVVMLHAIFTLITTIATELPGKPLVDLNDLKLVTGLDARFVVYFLIIFFSFAGVPPLAGFFIKAFVIESLVLIDALGTLLFVVVMVVINAYLYLRIINIVLFEERTADFVVRLRWLQQPLYYQGAVNLGGASSESAPLTYSYSDFYTPLFFLSVFLITFFCYLGAFFDFMTHFMVLLLIFS